MLPEDRERLIKYVDFLDSEISDFSKFSKVDWKSYQEDKDIRRNLERWIENIVNCSIDIAKVILISKDMRIPSTYKEILKTIGVVSPFDESFGEALSQSAGLRNILAYEYLDIRWVPIKRFIEEAKPIYERLCNGVRELLIY